MVKILKCLLLETQCNQTLVKKQFQKIREIFDTDSAKENGIQTFYFNQDDIVRSPLVKFIIQELEKAEKEEKLY